MNFWSFTSFPLSEIPSLLLIFRLTHVSKASKKYFVRGSNSSSLVRIDVITVISQMMLFSFALYLARIFGTISTKLHPVPQRNFFLFNQG